MEPARDRNQKPCAETQILSQKFEESKEFEGHAVRKLCTYLEGFDSLPHEIMMKIFFRLSPQELSMAQGTCRLWREIGNDRRLWDRLYRGCFFSIKSDLYEKVDFLARANNPSFIQNMKNGIAKCTETLTDTQNLGNRDLPDIFFSPDGRYFICIIFERNSWIERIEVYEAKAGNLLKTLNEQDPSRYITFTSDGLLCVVKQSGRGELIDLNNFNKTFFHVDPLFTEGDPIYNKTTALISKDNTEIILIKNTYKRILNFQLFDKSEIGIWNLSSNSHTKAFEFPKIYLKCPILTPDGKGILFGVGAKVQILNIKTGIIEDLFSSNIEDDVSCIRFSVNKKVIAVQYNMGQISLRNYKTGLEILSWKLRERTTYSFDYMDIFLLLFDNLYVTAMCENFNTTIRFWDLKKERMISEINVEKHRVYKSAFSPDGSLIAIYGGRIAELHRHGSYFRHGSYSMPHRSLNLYNFNSQ